MFYLNYVTFTTVKEKSLTLESMLLISTLCNLPLAYIPGSFLYISNT